MAEQGNPARPCICLTVRLVRVLTLSARPLWNGRVSPALTVSRSSSRPFAKECRWGGSTQRTGVSQSVLPGLLCLLGGLLQVGERVRVQVHPGSVVTGPHSGGNSRRPATGPPRQAPNSRGISRHCPPVRNRQITPSNCRRSRSGYGPYAPIGRYGPMNSRSASFSCTRVTQHELSDQARSRGRNPLRRPESGTRGCRPWTRSRGGRPRAMRHGGGRHPGRDAAPRPPGRPPGATIGSVWPPKGSRQILVRSSLRRTASRPRPAICLWLWHCRDLRVDRP